MLVWLPSHRQQLYVPANPPLVWTASAGLWGSKPLGKGVIFLCRAGSHTEPWVTNQQRAAQLMLTYSLLQDRQWGGGSFPHLLLAFLQCTALVIHSIALELAQQIKEALLF